MNNSQLHGYLNLNEASYHNLMRAPNIGENIPQTGYNLQATGYICSNFSKQMQDCGFIDTSVMLNADTRNKALLYVLEESNHQNLISGEVMVNPEKNQFLLLDDMSFIFSSLMGSQEDVLQKVVIPLTIYSASKESHGVALCIEADKKNNLINIIILEQHAKRDKGNLDFSKEVQLILEHLKDVYAQTGMQINTFQNEKPICREQGVCSIVSLEVCRRLLNSDNPLHLAQTGLIKLNAEQVQKLHHQNFQNYKKDHQSQRFTVSQHQNHSHDI